MDDTGRALLAAVVANPEEDTPRLVYADWLQERGDKAAGDVERADYIRTQIKIARTPPHEFCCEKTFDILSHAGGVKLFTPRCRCRACSLARRDYNLGKRFVVWEWCRGIPPGSVNVYRRGFVEEIKLTTEDFLANAEHIVWNKKQKRECPVTAHPIRKVKLLGGLSITTEPRGVNQIRLGDAAERITRVFRMAGRRVSLGTPAHEIFGAIWPGIAFTVESDRPPPPAPAGYVAGGSGFVPATGWHVESAENEYDRLNRLRNEGPRYRHLVREHPGYRLVLVTTQRPPNPLTPADRGAVFGPVECRDGAMLMVGRCRARLRDITIDVNKQDVEQIRYEADVVGEIVWTVEEPQGGIPV
jgi:uncharacterized protein (TIGR02996 family)